MKDCVKLLGLVDLNLKNLLASLRAEIERFGKTSREVFEIDFRQGFVSFFAAERGKLQGAIDTLQLERDNIANQVGDILSGAAAFDTDRLSELRERYTNLENTLAEVSAQFKDLADFEREFFKGDGLDSYIARWQEALDLFDQHQAQINSFENRLVTAFERSTDAFGTFAGRALSDFRKIGNAARQLAQTIIKNLLEALIIDPFTKALADSFRNFIQNLGSGGSGGGFFGFLRGILPFQNGGLAPPGFALVGERGPEIVNFQNPARVYSNADLSAALGGMGFSLTQIIESTDGPGVQRALDQALPGIVQAAEAASARNLSRPSSYRQQVLGR